MSKPTFVEFMGAMGGAVYINTDCIAMISIGSPQASNSGIYFDPVCVYFKKGQEIDRWIQGEEELYALFYIDDDHSPQWDEHWRKALGIPDFPEKEEG